MNSRLSLVLVGMLCGCTTNEMDNLLNDIESGEMTALSYEVGGFETFRCDPLKGEEILKSWIKTLKSAPVLASWPHPDNYLVISFNNGHDYRIRTFTGLPNLEYSVAYADGIYTGEQLMLETVCSGLEAHNKSLNVTPGANAPVAR